MSNTDPQSKADIVSALDHLRRDGLQYWSEFSAEQFAAPIGEAWSPADNVRHLIKSTRPVSMGLRLPHLVLGVLFGVSDGRSRTYAELQVQYQEVLRLGGQAGRFTPSKAHAPEDLSAWQAELVRSCRDVVGKLARVAARWEDTELDRYRLPHPLLGKLTVREMLLFTLYHYGHHRQNVARRLDALRTATNNAAADAK